MSKYPEWAKFPLFVDDGKLCIYLPCFSTTENDSFYYGEVSIEKGHEDFGLSSIEVSVWYYDAITMMMMGSADEIDVEKKVVRHRGIEIPLQLYDMSDEMDYITELVLERMQKHIGLRLKTNEKQQLMLIPDRELSEKANHWRKYMFRFWQYCPDNEDLYLLPPITRSRMIDVFEMFYTRVFGQCDVTAQWLFKQKMRIESGDVEHLEMLDDGYIEEWIRDNFPNPKADSDTEKERIDKMDKRQKESIRNLAKYSHRKHETEKKRVKSDTN